MEQDIRTSVVRDAKRIVINIGSSMITKDSAALDGEVIASLAAQVASLLSRRKEVIMISSGAIASGMNILGLTKRPKKISLLQAIAAIGQNKLMRSYEDAFVKEGLHVAQLLLTREDFSNRKRYLNAHATLLELLRYRTVPIVNENDTVSIDEIKFGDNDTLSSHVASLIGADLLIILSDVEGFYYGEKNAACVLKVIADIDEKITTKACGTKKESSVGGMVSKLDAARITMTSGIPMVLAHGRRKNVLCDILDGKDIGTLFLPKAKLTARFRWVAHAGKAKGRIVVDKGAREALTAKRKSLLSSGIVKVNGDFSKGDIVAIADETGCDFARGLVNYAAGDLLKVKGLNSQRLKELFGEHAKSEVIHRDNIVILAA